MSRLKITKEMDDKLLLLILYVLMGLLLVGLSVPLLREKVRPNPLYGFRVTRPSQAQEVWYAANNMLPGG
jgi:hypothetical protein